MMFHLADCRMLAASMTKKVRAWRRGWNSGMGMWWQPGWSQSRQASTQERIETPWFSWRPRRGSKLRYTFLNSRIHSRGGSARLCNCKTANFEPRPTFSLWMLKNGGL